MRTTVTIDDHLLAEVKLIAARSHRTIGSVLEDALRRLIADHEARRSESASYELPSYPTGGGLRPGVDLLDRDHLEGLMDDSPHAVL